MEWTRSIRCKCGRPLPPVATHTTYTHTAQSILYTMATTRLPFEPFVSDIFPSFYFFFFGPVLFVIWACGLFDSITNYFRGIRFMHEWRRHSLVRLFLFSISLVQATHSVHWVAVIHVPRLMGNQYGASRRAHSHPSDALPASSTCAMPVINALFSLNYAPNGTSDPNARIRNKPQKVTLR